MLPYLILIVVLWVVTMICVPFPAFSLFSHSEHPLYIDDLSGFQSWPCNSLLTSFIVSPLRLQHRGRFTWHPSRPYIDLTSVFLLHLPSAVITGVRHAWLQKAFNRENLLGSW